MVRKSPIRHKVKSHTRKNRPVREHLRGKGTKAQIGTKLPVRYGSKRNLPKNLTIVEAPLHKKIVGDIQVKDSNGVRIGGISYHIDKVNPRKATISAIGVDKFHRKKGIATGMIETLKRKFDIITATTTVRRANYFWKKLGFEKTKKQYPKDSIITRNLCQVIWRKVK